MEPLITWPDPLIQLLGFIGLFLAAGAVGFRWTALNAAGRTPEEGALAARMAGRAAAFGLAGALVSLALFGNRIPAMAERRHVTSMEFLTTMPGALQAALLALVVIGFTLARARVRLGWWLAAIALIGNLVVRPVVLNGWLRAVNPAHMLAGGLWIGTLFILVVCGIVPALRAPIDPARRGSLVAAMVNAFSPLALASAGCLAALGLITAWTHLKRLSALWTTPYGIALIVKLCLVGVVLALGAWNWRRQRPRLGTEVGAHDLKRSATAELSVAGAVLVVTAILVSLPTPK